MTIPPDTAPTQSPGRGAAFLTALLTALVPFSFLIGYGKGQSESKFILEKYFEFKEKEGLRKAEKFLVASGFGGEEYTYASEILHTRMWESYREPFGKRDRRHAPESYAYALLQKAFEPKMKGDALFILGRRQADRAVAGLLYSMAETYYREEDHTERYFLLLAKASIERDTERMITILDRANLLVDRIDQHRAEALNFDRLHDDLARIVYERCRPEAPGFPPTYPAVSRRDW